MAVAYATETTVTGSSTSGSAAVPSGTASGDLLVAFVNTGSGSTAFTPPAGWTSLIASWTDSNDSAGAAWYKVAASEPGSYTFSWTTSSDFCLSVRRFTGASTSTPIRTSRIDHKGATGAAYTSTALAGVQATDLTVVVGQMGDDNGVTTFTVTMPTSPWTTIDSFKPTSSPKFQGASYATGSQAGATFTSSSATAFWNIASFAIQAMGSATTSTGSVALAPLAVQGTAAGGGTTATGSVALAPLAVAGTGGAGAPVTSTGSVALAPLGVAGTAAGGNTTASGSVALQPLSVQAMGAGGDVPGVPSVPLLPVLPQIIVEAGLIPDSPTQGGTVLRLDDVTFGKLDTATLGTAITWTDISQWVISFTVTRPSTRLQGPLWNYQAGTVSVLLDNSDGRFDPDNLAGPYLSAGITQLVPMVPVRVRSVFASVGYSQYSGFADGWLPGGVTYEGGYAEITLPATDAFKVLTGITLPTLGSPRGVAADTGTRVADILGQAGWYTSAERRVINTGNSTLQGTTFGADALSLMQIAVDSEIGQLYVNGAGAVVFRNRRALLTDTRSNTVQAIFGDLPGPQPLRWQVQWNGDGATANPGAQSQLTGGVAAGSTYQASAQFYSPQGWGAAQLDVNWFTAGGGYISTSAGPVTNVPAGVAARVTTGTMTAPATAAQYTIVPQMLGTPASSVVMTAAWNHVAAVTELTGAAVTWTWAANNSATIANLGATPAAWYPTELPYAAPARASDDTTIANDVQATIAGGSNLQEVQDAASITKYLFPRTYSRTDLILQNDSDALNWAQWVLYVSKGGENRFNTLAIDPAADPVNLWPQVLGREIGDRIQIVNRPAGAPSPVVKECFIAGIVHTWDSPTSAWLTTWTLQEAAKYGSFLTLDNPSLGRLDRNALTFLGLPVRPVVRVVAVGQREQFEQQVAFAGWAAAGSPFLLDLVVHAVDQSLDLGQHAPLGLDLAEVAVSAGRHRCPVMRALGGNVLHGLRFPLVLIEPRVQERHQVIHPLIVSPRTARNTECPYPPGPLGRFSPLAT